MNRSTPSKSPSRDEALAGGGVLRPLIVAHAAALVSTLAASVVLEACVAGSLRPPGLALLDGLLAAAYGRRLGMVAWWQAVNLLLPLAACGLLAAGLAPLWYLAAFAVLFAIFGATCRTRVPLYFSNARAIRELVALLPRGGRVGFLDAGCGIGSVTAAVSRLRPDVEVTGIEAACGPWLVSSLRSLLAKRRFRAMLGSFWSLDLGNYQIVYVFLSPAPMAALWRKARGEMRPGSLLVSNSFPVPDIAPATTVHVQGSPPLYVWRM
jgi:hypothetical protein